MKCESIYLLSNEEGLNCNSQADLLLNCSCSEDKFQCIVWFYVCIFCLLMYEAKNPNYMLMDTIDEM